MGWDQGRAWGWDPCQEHLGSRLAPGPCWGCGVGSGLCGDGIRARNVPGLCQECPGAVPDGVGSMLAWDWDPCCELERSGLGRGGISGPWGGIWALWGGVWAVRGGSVPCGAGSVPGRGGSVPCHARTGSAPRAAAAVPCMDGMGALWSRTPARGWVPLCPPVPTPLSPQAGAAAARGDKAADGVGALRGAAQPGRCAAAGGERPGGTQRWWRWVGGSRCPPGTAAHPIPSSPVPWPGRAAAECREGPAEGG